MGLLWRKSICHYPNEGILSFSIRILVGIFLFGFTLSLAAREITNYLRHLPDDFVVVTRLLAGG